MNIKKILIYVLAVIVLVLIIWFVFVNKTLAPHKEITNFDECVAAGNIVLEIYPPICKTKNGQSFTQDIGNELEKIDLIKVNSPRPNAVVGKVIQIEGEARGQWFFEASFPIKLLDESGMELSTTIAQAKSDWMTEEFVPFEATLEFKNTAGIKNAALMLSKDNPSGLPENDDFLIIPIKFE